MRDRNIVRHLSIAAALVGGLSLSVATFAQADDPATQAQGQSNEQLLKDFVHFINIHKPEMAAAWGQALLERGLSPEEFVDLVGSIKDYTFDFDEAIVRGQRHPELEPTAAALARHYEAGKLAIARKPEEISRNIALLKGSQRNRVFARDRLLYAGEYAAPQLLDAYLNPPDMVTEMQVRQVLVQLARHSVMPLATALPNLAPEDQEKVVGVLGDIPYETSAPFLYELHASSGSPEVKLACERALLKITGIANPRVPLNERFVQLANSYYYESPSLTSFPGEAHQLVWFHKPEVPGSGLYAVPVLTPVYHEAMAMRLTERALAHNAGDREALALWVASNYSREIDTPEEYENPAYPSRKRGAEYFAVISGPETTQPVLARALDDRDTQLARRAIAAIERTAGGMTLWTGGQSDRAPLLEALRYPNRRVQYEAALAIGAAQPRTTFDGSDRVVPILASAIRDASESFALVISNVAEDRPRLAQVLRDQGYTVLTPGGSLADVQQALAEAPGVDVLLVDLPRDGTTSLIEAARNHSKLRSTPILTMLDRQSASELASKYDRDPTVHIVREGTQDVHLAAAVQQLVERAEGGAITPEEAEAYKTRALAVLRDLAVSGNTALNVADAATALVAALPDADHTIKMQIAEVLAYIPADRVQTALLEEALAAEGETRVQLLAATADSAKRWGNLVQPRLISQLVRVASSEEETEATAAAALMGAFGLPNNRVIPLILGEEESLAVTERR